MESQRSQKNLKSWIENLNIPELQRQLALYMERMFPNITESDGFPKLNGFLWSMPINSLSELLLQIEKMMKRCSGFEECVEMGEFKYPYGALHNAVCGDYIDFMPTDYYPTCACDFCEICNSVKFIDVMDCPHYLGIIDNIFEADHIWDQMMKIFCNLSVVLQMRKQIVEKLFQFQFTINPFDVGNILGDLNKKIIEFYNDLIKHCCRAILKVLEYIEHEEETYPVANAILLMCQLDRITGDDRREYYKDKKENMITMTSNENFNNGMWYLQNIAAWISQIIDSEKITKGHIAEYEEGQVGDALELITPNMKPEGMRKVFMSTFKGQHQINLYKSEIYEEKNETRRLLLHFLFVILEEFITAAGKKLSIGRKEYELFYKRQLEKFLNFLKLHEITPSGTPIILPYEKVRQLYAEFEQMQMKEEAKRLEEEADE